MIYSICRKLEIIYFKNIYDVYNYFFIIIFLKVNKLFNMNCKNFKSLQNYIPNIKYIFVINNDKYAFVFL